MTDFKVTNSSNLNIVMTDTDDIDRYESVAIHFLYHVLNLDYHSCFISNDSWLSDFTGCNSSDELYERSADEYEAADKTGLDWFESRQLSFETHNKLWRAFITDKVVEVYGLHYDTASTPLIEIFADIEQHVGLARILEENEHIVFPPKTIEPEEVKAPEPFDINTTTSSLLYAKHTGCTRDEAQAIIKKRLDEKYAGKIFKPWRPSDDKKIVH